MLHDTPLIATIAVSLGLAFVLGFGAQKLRLPTIVGYLAAGIAVGPFTPGYTADVKLAAELAEIGVVLLMFGVGLHFSARDLISVRAIAIPGALAGIATGMVIGLPLGWALGWRWDGGLVFGIALSVTSTVVLLRTLQERHALETERGRIATGWLIVEDIAMVLVLVMLPTLAGASSDPGVARWFAGTGLGPVTGAIAETILKLALFAGIMLVLGRRLVPWVLHHVAHSGSRELFRLSVLAIALGVAFGAAKLFGVSVALGAFLAGMVLAESPLSSQAARETLPLRDAFAVLFFVSVGMLFDPRSLIAQPLPLLVSLIVVLAAKPAAAYFVMRRFGHPHETALWTAASLAMIGEFSFILGSLAVALGLLPATARDLIVAVAIVSILLNPLWLFLLDRRAQRAAAAAPAPPPEPPPAPTPSPRALVIGHGRVGSRVSQALLDAGMTLTIVDEDESSLERLKDTPVTRVVGHFDEPATLDGLDLTNLSWLVVAIPDPFEAGSALETVRTASPGVRIVARAHSDAAIEHLRQLGAEHVLMAEEEVATAMQRAILGIPAR
ncbi:MAG: sodium:proton antiporter [Alphaproteobacteria bacterium]|nr:sodium:proton antiporter [Alphaproteobacteria bacterium]